MPRQQPSQSFRLVIDADGTISFIYTDTLAELFGQGETVRASNVEPCEGGWMADMSPSGYDVRLGPFKTRAQALSEEVKFVEANVL